MWYPKKEAFITGRVLVESPDSVGTNSLATGYESKAVGDWSQALGFRTIARGDYSTAIGKNAITSGLGSFSFGDNTLAYANNTFVAGKDSRATGTGAFSLGNLAQSSGSNAFALGYNVLASNTSSFSLGNTSTASGPNSVAIGNLNYAAGSGSFAAGVSSTAGGTNATAIGRGCEATGNNTVALGYYSKALYNNATAIGYRATANGQWSVAIGDLSYAGNPNLTYGESYAFGYADTATGIEAVAIGSASRAAGDGSVAIGRKIITQGKNQVVVGQYNTPVGNPNSADWADPAFLVGAGDALQRANVFTVYRDGSMKLEGHHFGVSPIFHITPKAGYEKQKSIIKFYGTFGNGNAVGDKVPRSFAQIEVGSADETAWEGGYMRFLGNTYDIVNPVPIEIMRLNTSSGFVGIGTPNPLARLHVKGDIYLPYNSGNTVLTMTMGNGNSLFFKPQADALRLESNHTGNPTLLWIDKSGAIGIGVNSPSQRMEIGGTDSKIYMNSASSNMIMFNSVGVAAPSFTNRSTGTKLILYQGVSSTNVDFALGIESNTLWYSIPQAISTYVHKFYAGTTEIMRIQGDGRLGLGTTTPGTKCEILAAGDNLRLRRSSIAYMDFGISTSGTLIMERNYNGTIYNGATCNGLVWSDVSDRNMKENIRGINTAELLDKIEQLPITIWNYIGQDPDVLHIGPMAQDFYSIFRLGDNDRTISSLDPAGISLAAIQELIRQNKEQEQKISAQEWNFEQLQKENERLSRENENLQNRMERLEDVVNRLAAIDPQERK